MKKFINNPEQCEDQMILGLVKAFPQHIRKLDCGNVVVRSRKKENGVALISGGGSGHEPAHAGYVGPGMLDAAVAGAVFTSPTPDQVYEGIRAIATEDVKAVSRIPGVGKKTAQRMILELKGSLADFGAVVEAPSGEGTASAAQTARDGVYEALLSMGFTSKEAELALKGAPEDGSEGVLLQYALKKLGS